MYTSTTKLQLTKKLRKEPFNPIDIMGILLYSQTRGVKQQYILYISGSVAYGQYIHTTQMQ